MLRVVEGPVQDVLPVLSPVLGRIDVRSEDIVDFAVPISGFPSCSRYVLLPYAQAERIDAAMQWLQAIEAPFHTFLVCDPWSVVPDYHPEVSETDLAAVRASAPTDVQFLSILTVAGDMDELTINLQAPLLVNRRFQSAKQALLLNGEVYAARTRVRFSD